MNLHFLLNCRDKYAGIGGGTLSNTFSGDLFNTNALITLVSGGITVFTHSAGGDFGATKLVAALWLINLFQTLNKSGFNADSIMANKEAAVTAAILGVMAFVE